MKEDGCAWYRCGREVCIIYGACRDKRGTPLMIPLCDYHWGKIAGLGSEGAGKVLQQHVPNIQIGRERHEEQG